MYTAACSDTEISVAIGLCTLTPTATRIVPAAIRTSWLIGMAAAKTRNGDGPT
jgi:hypothetical protein